MEETTSVALYQQQEGAQLIATEVLREKIRNYTREQRDFLRMQQTDAMRFGLGEIQTKIEELDNLTEKDVLGLATRIKRRKHATSEDMYRLSYAFLQSVKNICAFANTPGALQVIVKELTGNDAARQVSASECLCNLSLGEEPVCDKIVSFGGSYVVTYLNSTEESLKRTSLWTLANILATNRIGSGCGKSAQALMQMELFPKLWNLYVADKGEYPEDCRVDAAICLQLICCTSKRLLRPADEIFLLENLHRKNPVCEAGEYHLQIVFHANIVQPTCALSESQVLYLINYALSNLSHSDNMVSTENRLRILYAVRILANLLATQMQCLTLLWQQMSMVWHTNLVAVLNRLFAYQDDTLTRETLWLLKNVLIQAQQQGGTHIQHNFLEKLFVSTISTSK